MAIVRCPRGHFYDNGKSDSCPVCSGSTAGPRWEMDAEKTVSLEAVQDSEMQTVLLSAVEPERETVRGSWDSEKTVALGVYGARELLVGWLVCTDGPEKGRDYRLYPGFNRIGRELSSDVCLQDPEVSRENHASVVYDGKKGQFYLVPGSGTLTYIAGRLVEQAVEIEEMTSIRIGGSTLELVAFCKGEHVWKS